ILPHGRVLRYPFAERLNHWIAAFSYIYLLLTGLAFWSPWCFWIAVMLGGGQTSRMLHPWIGLIFFFAVMRMYSLWAPQMRTTDEDRQWWRSLGHYVRNEDDKMPPAGRYNAGQKALFWSFFYGAIILLFTGLILWFPEEIPWNLRWLRYISVFLHPVAALATIANFMIHIYMSVFAERGAFGSVIRGDVSLEFAKRYHPGWYKELTSGSSSAPRK
ncbi:MAG TPA: formate dehydrogenase subunit gamma, partial [Candidatus Eremiobacteraceae bacterium]|nr:formate dehydrogenase subunit gamma [Candidatus Eremiobacteraceae bacterium]